MDSGIDEVGASVTPEEFAAAMKAHADPGWDASHKAAFAVLLGMAFDLGLGPGGVGEAAEQAKVALANATPEDLAELVAEEA